MYYVYLIASDDYNETYVGSTNDLRRRLRDHNNGVEVSTRRYRPWRLVSYEAYVSEQDARQREKKLKAHGNAMKMFKERALHSFGQGGLPSTTFCRAKSSAGFTIIESLVAISILLVAIAGPLSLITQSLSSAIFAKQQLIAVFLAQEATEFVRNTRDNNVLGGNPWLSPLKSSCAAPNGCIVDIIKVTPCAGVCPPLRYNPSTGQYGYNTASDWNNTIFTRTVVVTEVASDIEALVTVSVSWEKGLIAKTISVNDRIFNWQQ